MDNTAITIKYLTLTTVEPEFTILHKPDATQTDTDILEVVLGGKEKALPTIREETFQ